MLLVFRKYASWSLLRNRFQSTLVHVFGSVWGWELWADPNLLRGGRVNTGR